MSAEIVRANEQIIRRLISNAIEEQRIDGNFADDMAAGRLRTYTNGIQDDPNKEEAAYRIRQADTRRHAERLNALLESAGLDPESLPWFTRS